MKKTFENWAYHDYTTKLSVSIVYALIASVALNFFYQPGHIYSSGITGLAQILTTLSKSLIGFEVPVSTTLYLLNKKNFEHKQVVATNFGTQLAFLVCVSKKRR